jgi:Cellulose biosynthesis protein BcsN
MYRIVICIVFAAGLSACSASRSSETAKVSLDQIVQAGPDKYRDSNASADTKIQQPAFATLPPEAGRVVRVSHKRSVEGVRQEIFYDQSAPGLEASGIDLRIRTSNAAALDEPLRMAKPTEAGIRSELSSQFPKMTMQIVDHPRSNAYGPYGLAVGRWANGARCIYAWQWIDNLKSNLSSEGAPASVRVRLCRKDVSLDQLASNVDHLQIDPDRIEQADVRTGTAGQILANLPEPATKPAGIRAAQHPRRSRVAPLAEKPYVTRGSAVASSAIPQSVQGVRESQLDPSLPAAAYRGPITTGSTSAMVGKVEGKTR